MINDRLILVWHENRYIEGIKNIKLMKSLVFLRLNRASPSIDPKTKDLAFADAVDAYIAKMLVINPSKLNRVSVNTYRDELYNIFLNKPMIAFDSILFKQKLAKLFFTQEQYEAIIKKKNSMAKSFYDDYLQTIKIPNATVSDYVLRFAMYQIGSGNENINKFLDELYKYLITYHMVNNGYFAKEFVIKYSSYLAAKDLNIVPPSIYISNYKFGDIIMKKLNLGTSYGNTGVITINRNSLLNNVCGRFYDDLPVIYNYMHVAFHETRHSKQASDAKNNVLSSAGFDQLRYAIFNDYLSDANNKEYTINYAHSENEADANKYAWYFLYKMISKYNPLDADNLFEISSKRVKSAYQELVSTKFNMASSAHEEADKYNVLRMYEIIQKHPELLNKYKMLRLLYRKNGELKGILELLETENGYSGDERNQVSMIFKDYYTYAILCGAIDRIKLDTLNQERQFLVLNKLFSLLADEYESLKNSIKVYNKFEDNTSFRQKEFNTVCKRRILRIKKLESFLANYQPLIDKLREIDIAEGNKRAFGMTLSIADRMKTDLLKYLARLKEYGITNLNTIEDLNSLSGENQGRGGR